MIKFDRKCSGKARSCIENNLHDKLKLSIQPLLAVQIKDKDVNKLRHDECNNNNQMKCKVLYSTKFNEEKFQHWFTVIVLFDFA